MVLSSIFWPRANIFKYIALMGFLSGTITREIGMFNSLKRHWQNLKRHNRTSNIISDIFQNSFHKNENHIQGLFKTVKVYM